MSFIDKSIAGVKELVFAETADAGKVCQISWSVDKKSGSATMLVPLAAYKRFSHRATLRCLQIKIPDAQKITKVKTEYGSVKTSQTEYCLIRADFVL